MGSEDCPLAENINTVSDLVNVLKARGDGFAGAFANLDIVRVAVNQEHVPFDHPLCNEDEVAFFPPVTGG